MPSSMTKVNPDIEKERQSGTFDVEEFASWWYGGVDKLKEKREIEQEIFDEPDLKDEIPMMYLSYQNMYDQSVKKFVFAGKKLRQIQERINPGGDDIFPGVISGAIGYALNPQSSPVIVHHSMFVPTIKGQGTPEQIEKWLPLCLRFDIIGTYAQTELGHGTFLKGLETRADYDSTTEEFIMHSPTITAYKWWPGGLGHTVNHAIVAAQLYINNQPHGLQLFVVPLRDKETHMPLPGIIIGDIGNKMLFQSVNNGFLGFNNYRIPRMNMLMRNAQVLPDGTFNKSPVSILTYFTMVQIRVLIVSHSYEFITRAAAIATRYAAIRRQGIINPREPEHQILDFLIYQLKLFPQIANGIAMKLTSDYLREMLITIQNDVLNGELERLPEMHALTCCLKAVTTKECSKRVEILRLACGDHGYLLASNLPTLYCSAVAGITYEGESTVLLLQTSRYLMKSWAMALAGEKLVPTVAYLSEAVKSNKFSQWNGSWECLAKALQFVAANKIRIAFNHLEERKNLDMTIEEATDYTSIELVAAAEFHGHSFLATTTWEQITSKTSERSDNFNMLLFDLLELYLVSVCLDHLGDILKFIVLSEDDIDQLENRLENVLAKVRPNAVAIVDGFDYHDRVLNSVLGSYDGNAYERLFASSQQSPMNQNPVQRSFHEYLKPLMRSNM